MAPAHGKLVVRVKTMQRMPPQRQAWEDYCTEHLKGYMDPNKHDAKALMAFLQYMELDCSEDDDDDDDIDDDDPFQHESLVWRVKEFQRGGHGGKEAWEKFCDSKLGGVKDPAKHYASSMLKFLKVNENGPPRGKHKKTPKGHVRGGRDGGKSSGAQNEHVKFIQKGQLCSASFKKAWKAYCNLHHGGDTDPANLQEDDLSYFTDYLGQVLLAAVAAGGVPEGDHGSAAPAAKKRPGANGDDLPALKASRTAVDAMAVCAMQEPSKGQAPAEKKKLTMKKSVADEIRRINASGVFSSQIKLGAVAEPLSRLDEETALAVLRGVEAAEGVKDATATIVDSVEATLNQEIEE